MLLGRVAVAREGGRWRPRVASEVQVPDPVDQVEEQEGRGEEHAGVGVQLQHVDARAAAAPGARRALLVAAEEAPAVLAAQALGGAGVLQLRPVRGVAQRERRGRRRPRVQQGIALRATGATEGPP